MSRRRYAFRQWAVGERGKWSNREAYNTYMRAYMRKRRRTHPLATSSAIIAGWLL